MGLRALFSLVEELIRRFRYLDETIAVVLGIVGGQAADRGPLQGRADRQPGDRARRLRGRDHAPRSCATAATRRAPPSGERPPRRAQRGLWRRRRRPAARRFANLSAVARADDRGKCARERTQSDQLVALQRVQGLLDVARLVGSDRSLDSVLSEIARTISEALGFQGVAFNLYRPGVGRLHRQHRPRQRGDVRDAARRDLRLVGLGAPAARIASSAAAPTSSRTARSTGPTPSSARATCPTGRRRAGDGRLGARRRAVRALPALRRPPARHRLGRRAGLRHAARPTTSSTCSSPWCR